MSEHNADLRYLDRSPKRDVRLPLLHNGDDVVEVGYNGRMFLIRRGETVTLPLPLIEILEQSHVL